MGVVDVASAGTSRARASRARMGRAVLALVVAVLGLLALPEPAAALSAPLVTQQPGSRTVTAFTGVTFTSIAIGDPTPTVQWERFASGAWSQIPGATSTTYGFVAEPWHSGTAYRAVFTNSEGTATSNVATLVVQLPNTPPAITLQPTSQTGVLGQTVTFTAAASGSPAPTVQWQRGVTVFTSTTWTNISGATSPSYSFTPGNLDTGTRYRAIFTNASGSATTNGNATLVVQWAPQVSIQTGSGPVQFPLESADDTHRRSIVASIGANPSATIAWDRSDDDGATWNPVTSDPGYSTGEALTITLGAADDGARFRVTATNIHGSASATVTARVGVVPTITLAPQRQNVAAGSTATFRSEATSPTPMTVEWATSPTSPTSYTTIPGATSATLTMTAPSANRLVRVTYRNEFGSASELEYLIALPAVDPPGVAPYVTTQPVASAVLEVGQSITLSAEGAGDPAPTVRWQRLTGAQWVDIPGATGGEHTFTATSNASATVSLQAVFTNSAGFAETRLVSISVRYPPYVTGVDTTKVVALTNASSTVSTGMVLGITGNPTPTYQWQRSTDDGETWADIPGATGSSYTLQAGLAHDLDRFRAVGTNAHGSVVGPVTTLQVGVRPTFTQSPTPQTAVAGTTATFTVAVSSPSPATVSWERAPTSGGTYVPIASCAGLLSCSFTVTTADDGHHVRAKVTNPYASATSSAQRLTVTTSVPAAPTSVAATAGSTRATVTWSAPPTDGGQPVTGYTVTPWRDGLPLAPVAVGPTETSVEVAGLTNGVAHTFTVTATNVLGTGPASAPSAPVTPVGVVLTSDVTSSVTGQTVTLRVESTIGSTGTVRVYDGATLLGSRSLSAGVAVLTTTKLAVGSHTLVASLQRTTGGPLTWTDPLPHAVAPGGTSTSVAIEPGPTVVGARIGLRATVAALAPATGTRSGQVRFYDGATLLGTANLTSGAATLWVRPAVGAHAITAEYVGSASWAGSTSAAVDLEVTPGSTTTTVTTSVTPSASGQNVSIRARVAAVAPASGTILGLVELREGATIVATAPLVAGQASFSVKPTVGVHDYELAFTGSPSFLASSGSVEQTVVRASTTVALSSSKPVAAAGSTGTISARVTTVAPGTGTATGTVELRVDGVLVHTGALVAGKATMPIGLVPIGAHEVVATYLGSTTHDTSTSAPLVQTIT